jgi:hypothetical protein
MAAPDFTKPTATDVAFRDPLSDATRKVRAQLIFASTFAILVTVYDLKVNKTPWLDIEVPSTAPQLLNGLLSVAVAYLFFSFLLFAFQDFRRWRVSGELHLLHSSFDTILKSNNSLNAIHQHIEKLTADAHLADAIRTAVAEAAAEIPRAKTRLENLRSNLTSLSRLQWFRFAVVEIGTPVVLAAIALAKTWTAIVPFIVSVFK